MELGRRKGRQVLRAGSRSPSAELRTDRRAAVPARQIPMRHPGRSEKRKAEGWRRQAGMNLQAGSENPGAAKEAWRHVWQAGRKAGSATT